MKRGAKGANAERELMYLFWGKNWACSRVAGSGVTRLPSPDLIAGNSTRKLAIECKSINGKFIQLYKEELDRLQEFSNRFGSEAWLAIRFNNKSKDTKEIGWRFLEVKTIPLNKNGNYSITLQLAKERGVKFEEFM